MQCVRLVPLLSILVPTTPSQLIIDIYPTPILASRTCGKSGAARAMDSHCGTGSMLSFGPFISSTAILAYLMDTHSANSLHVITLNDFARHMLTYGTTFFANSLVLSAGVRRTLFVIGVLLAACGLSAVPMYVYGKRVRSFVSGHPST